MSAPKHRVGENSGTGEILRILVRVPRSTHAELHALLAQIGTKARGERLRVLATMMVGVISGRAAGVAPTPAVGRADQAAPDPARQRLEAGRQLAGKIAGAARGA